MSDKTKKYCLWYIVFLVTSILLNIGPLAFYSIKAVMESELVHEKVTLVMTVFIVFILTCVSLVNKVAMRSRLWILLIGIYICLDAIMTPLIIIAVCQTLDELVINPLSKSFREKYIINKQIDGRI